MTDRTLTVDASAERSARPKSSRVELRVRGEGTTAAEARRDARDRGATLRESLRAVVAGEDVRRTRVTVEETDTTFEPETDLPYGASERFHVNCTPETVEEVVVCATDAGASVSDVIHTLHEARRRELRDEALAAATERAREKAERIADVEELTVGEVRCVSTHEGRTGMESLVEEALVFGECSSLDPDPVEVSAAVEVVYGLMD